MFPAQVQDASPSRSVVTTNNVWRHPACAGSEYVSKHGFRVRSSSAHASNLIEDFNELFCTSSNTSTGTKTPPLYISYHAALAAIHHTMSCTAFFGRNNINNIRYIYHRQGRGIARLLSPDVSTIAMAKVQMQSTELSALRRYQRTRVLAGPMIALLAMKLAYGGGSSNTNGTVDCILLHTIMRRAMGSENRAIHIARTYIPQAVNYFRHVSKDAVDAKHEMKLRYDDQAPLMTKRSELFNGPVEFHKAEYYANKCIRLIECDDAERKWRELEKKIHRVRRGEITVYDVLFDPSDNYWVFSIHHTFYYAMKNHIDANTKWLKVHDPYQIVARSKSHKKKKEGSVWRSPYSSGSGIAIDANSKSYIQTTQMIHTMYTFLLRTQNILTDRFINAFGFSITFRNTIIMRFHHLSSISGDEASALMLGQFIPCLMTPEIHLDINVCTRGFQDTHFYINMSSQMFGKLKAQFKSIIPARHNGLIDRTTFMTALYNA